MMGCNVRIDKSYGTVWIALCKFGCFVKVRLGWLLLNWGDSKYPKMFFLSTGAFFLSLTPEVPRIYFIYF